MQIARSLSSTFSELSTSECAAIYLSRAVSSTTLFSTVPRWERWKCVRWFHKCHSLSACTVLQAKGERGKGYLCFSRFLLVNVRSPFLRGLEFVDLNGVHVLRVSLRLQLYYFRSGHPWWARSKDGKVVRYQLLDVLVYIIDQLLVHCAPWIPVRFDKKGMTSNNL